MSLLIYQHYMQEVAVFTDTLATTLDGNALAFCNKSFVQPQIGIVMTMTGVAQLGEIWSHDLNGPIFAEDIDDLDSKTPAQLRKIWQVLKGRYKAEFGFEMTITSTIYHFGWSMKHGHYVRYIYRSESDFQSEHHTEKGIGVKPQPKDAKANPIPETLDVVIPYAELLRCEQLECPASERVHIGGELVMVLMSHTDNGQETVTVAKVHKFSGYDNDQQAIKRMSETERLKHIPPGV